MCQKSIAQAKHLLVRTCSSASLGLGSARLDVRIARRPLNTAGKFEGLHSEGSDSCRAGKRCKTWSSSRSIRRLELLLLVAFENSAPPSAAPRRERVLRHCRARHAADAQRRGPSDASALHLLYCRPLHTQAKCARRATPSSPSRSTALQPFPTPLLAEWALLDRGLRGRWTLSSSPSFTAAAAGSSDQGVADHGFSRRRRTTPVRVRGARADKLAASTTTEYTLACLLLASIFHTAASL